MSKKKQTIIFATNGRYYKVIDNEGTCWKCAFASRSGLCPEIWACEKNRLACYALNFTWMKHKFHTILGGNGVKFQQIYHIPTNSRIIYKLERYE